MKILLVAGHGQYDPGAQGGGYEERATMRQLITKIKNLIPDVVDLYDMSLDCYQQNGLATTPYKEVIEFHMDGATNVLAKGGHVIVYRHFQPDNLDNRLKNTIEKQIGIWVGTPTGFDKRGDGVKDLQNLNVAARRGISYRLLELGFITNVDDRAKAIGDMDKLAKLLAEAIANRKIEGAEEEVRVEIKEVVKEVKVVVAYQGMPERKNKGLDYRAHIRQQGWLGYVNSGIAGTVGLGRQLEAIEVFLNGQQLDIEAHTAKIGWQKPAKIGGTTGKGLALEAFRINSTKIRYRAHVAKQGWQDWKTGNAIAGTIGKGLAIEALEIELV